MCNLIRSPRLFAAATVLFALATFFNSTETNAKAPNTRLTVAPLSQETIRSGPAVELGPNQPAHS